MKQLYPIIRRKRRSLIIEDVPPVVVAPVELVVPNPELVATTDSTGETPVPPKPSHAKTSSKSKQQ